MNILLKNSDKTDNTTSVILLVHTLEKLPAGYLSKQEKDYIKKQLEQKNELNFFQFNKLSRFVIVCITPEKKEDEEFIAREKTRRLGSKMAELCKSEQLEKLSVRSADVSVDDVFDFLEGLLLGSYAFTKYKSRNKNRLFPAAVSLSGVKLSILMKKELELKVQSVFKTRDWVNEPGSTLLPKVFADQVSEMFSGLLAVKTEVLTGKKITALKMAGMEAVSKGGPNQPAFIILEYLPKHLKEMNPFVIIGKGVFFDTGGINLKPGNALADMKCDMSGAAVVASVINVIASLRLDIPVIGLIPATENRPGNLAYLPGDVLTMMNGLSVEIKNTDAEGRLILADALCYAKKYNPSLVVTIATLTGSANATFGPHAIAGMHHNAEFYFSMLKGTSFDVYERIAELPMWEEYDQMIESQVADIQNVGGKYAGAITAAKFLQKFTDAPFIHLDIAGPAFYEKTDGYIPAGGTGQGVRLLFEFFRKIEKLQNKI
jgi:leucyl aminopeptidase